MARVKGDDGLIADDVGYWAEEKHRYLTRYISISRAARKKFLSDFQHAGVRAPGGATFVDLFCGTGRSRIRENGKWSDGSAVAAWIQSVRDGAPFSNVFIADRDEEAVKACEARLKAAGAPVETFIGDACDAARALGPTRTPYGLNLVFLDPYNLDLDFTIIEHLSKITRVDMMIHLNQMDMQRNLISLVEDETENRLDRFAPGWRDVINRSAPRATIEAQVYEYWRTKVRALGDAETSTDQKLITGSQNQPLYWLVLVAAHKLAHKFWSESLSDGQAALFG